MTTPQDKSDETQTDTVDQLEEYQDRVQDGLLGVIDQEPEPSKQEE